MNRLQDQGEVVPASQVPNRREFLRRASVGGLMAGAVSLGSPPAGNQKADRLPIPETHFPNRLYLLVWRSVANQVRFYMLREELNKGKGNKKPLLAEMEHLTINEMEAARKQYLLATKDSTIGFEATNHYYYRPLDLVEKVVNCDQVLKALAEL